MYVCAYLSLYTYIYIYTCTYIHTYRYTTRCVYKYIYIYIYLFIYIHTYVYTHITQSYNTIYCDMPLYHYTHISDAVLYTTTTQMGAVYRGVCLNSSAVAVSETASRRWWCIESLFPILYRERLTLYILVWYNVIWGNIIVCNVIWYLALYIQTHYAYEGGGRRERLLHHRQPLEAHSGGALHPGQGGEVNNISNISNTIVYIHQLYKHIHIIQYII